jgi:hypothetical protein
MFVGEPDWKMLLARTRRRWLDNIKRNLRGEWLVWCALILLMILTKGSCKHGNEPMSCITFWEVISICTTDDHPRMAQLNGVSYVSTLLHVLIISDANSHERFQKRNNDLQMTVLSYLQVRSTPRRKHVVSQVSTLRKDPEF